MKRTQRFRYEMFVRVRDFGKEHQSLFPESSMGGQSFATVSAAVDAIEQHLTNRVVARAESQKVKAQTKAAVYEYLKAIASTARRVTESESGINPFRMPKRRAVSLVLSSARAFIAEAKPREDQFVKRGLPATFLADFGKLVDELEKAATAQLNSRTERRLARAGIEETLEQGLNTIRELDVFVPNALRLDPIRVAAWRGARRIEALNQPPAKKPAPAGDTAPTPPQATKSAAGTVLEPATVILKAS